MKRVITINSNDLEKSLYTKELLTKKLEENNFLVSSKLEEKESIILFDYNTNKVFDKSKTYTVELGEENEV